MNALITKILIAMGLSDGDIPTNILEHFVTEWQVEYPTPEQECQVLHNSVVSLYGWLIKESAKDASGGGKVREKEMHAEIEMYGYDKSVDWKNALNSYLKAPWEAFPSCRSTFTNKLIGVVKVGGVSEKEIDDINNDKDIRTGGASETCGVRQSSVSKLPRGYPRNSFRYIGRG